MPSAKRRSVNCSPLQLYRTNSPPKPQTSSTQRELGEKHLLPIRLPDYTIEDMKMPTVNSDIYLTTAQAATKLKISQESVRKYCANFDTGKTPAIKGILMGRSWFIAPKEIDRYLKERQGVGRPRQAS